MRDRGLVDAATVADKLGVSRDYVHDRAAELGAIRLGSGPKARLRFDLERVLAAVAVDRPPAAPARARARVGPRRQLASARVPLLPIRGRAPGRVA